MVASLEFVLASDLGKITYCSFKGNSEGAA